MNVVVRCSNPDSMKEMQNWNLQFSPNLLTIEGRHLQPEMIFQTADKRNAVSILWLFLIQFSTGFRAETRETAWPLSTGCSTVPTGPEKLKFRCVFIMQNPKSPEIGCRC